MVRGWRPLALARACGSPTRSRCATARHLCGLLIRQPSRCFARASCCVRAVGILSSHLSASSSTQTCRKPRSAARRPARLTALRPAGPRIHRSGAGGTMVEISTGLPPASKIFLGPRQPLDRVQPPSFARHHWDVTPLPLELQPAAP